MNMMMKLVFTLARSKKKSFIIYVIFCYRVLASVLCFQPPPGIPVKPCSSNTKVRVLTTVLKSGWVSFIDAYIGEILCYVDTISTERENNWYNADIASACHNVDKAVGILTELICLSPYDVSVKRCETLFVVVIENLNNPLLLNAASQHSPSHAIQMITALLSTLQRLLNKTIIRRVNLSESILSNTLSVLRRYNEVVKSRKLKTICQVSLTILAHDESLAVFIKSDEEDERIIYFSQEALRFEFYDTIKKLAAVKPRIHIQYPRRHSHHFK